MSQRHDDLEDDIEQVTETVTESVKGEYENGTLDTITVTATWKRATYFKGANDACHVDMSITAEATFTVSRTEQRAALKRFYPDTNQTGKHLKRRVLQSVRALDHCATVVDERTAPEIEVRDPIETLQNQLAK